MSEATMHAGETTAGAGGTPQPARGRARTCIGCSAQVDATGSEGADLIRLILGPDGEIAVDSKGGGFGRGAHLHARRACVERAARAGLLRATKGNARTVIDAGEGEKGEALSADSLARAIQRSMDRRIEGLLAAAVRSRQVARGADAVTGACRRGEAELVVVATDAAAAADLTEVRRAVAEGRAVAWGTKAKLGTIVAPSAARGRLPSSPESHSGQGVGVVAIASRTIAEALRRAVHAAGSVGSAEASTTGETPRPAPATRSRGGEHPPRPPRGRPRAGPPRDDRSGG